MRSGAGPNLSFGRLQCRRTLIELTAGHATSIHDPSPCSASSAQLAHQPAAPLLLCSKAAEMQRVCVSDSQATQHSFLIGRACAASN